MLELKPTKYIIHACLDRMWYIDDYLIPSMIDQGIDPSDIKVGCDTKRVGNLQSCMDIFSHITQIGGTWHMQDDVIICRDFKKRTEEISMEHSHDVVCGFVIEKDGNSKHVGYVKPQEMWWSFPCIWIPNNLARECVHWFYDVARYKSIYSWMIPTKKYDDYFFKEFMIVNYPDYKVLNLKPNLVDHIDYLLGGTVINKERKNKNVRAVWFEDLDLVENLEKKLVMA